MSYNPNVPDFDNIAYDDLQKMKENFQILANIATSREDILSLAVEAGDILDSRIVEHNLNILSPSNGYYIRWENGLQVCWHVLNLGPGNAYGNGTLSDIYRTKPKDFYFPAVFIVSPKAFLTPHYIPSGGTSIVFSASYRNITNLSVMSIQAIMGVSVSDDIFVDVLIVGRWK